MARAKLGWVSYNGVIRASVAPAGLALSVVFVFRVGHPPLLIPWLALEPVQTRKFLWVTYYTTAVQVGNGRVNFEFADQNLVQAVQPWLRVA
ncbi:hypothetical protein GCM10022409_00570 [Hymenobacter glaciei]|uniref:ABC transporter permease n=1 Tax=Hymenobacter glaciei TaxID=877209 RepID=A0ABP7T500_9BACT